ncbi:hypothetical protein AB833_12925 [Chromatiales bacterium (ex Bugula neritina AB1)]|nr:hypothetical protein AB833_12925 [Chromatiales bacterium (ex Bugula neritina AB1)]
MSRALFVLQGGGPTAVINATLAGIAETAGTEFDQLCGFRHSFECRTENPVLDLTPILDFSARSQLQLLAGTPGALLQSSRMRVEEKHLRSMLDILRKSGASDLIGIGGNGTLSVLARLHEFAESEGYPLNIIGAPKTVDNDLNGVHAAPGYGSAARFVAMAVRDYDCDFKAMSSFDNVTILETMGRNSGWLAAASILLKRDEDDSPHIVLLPEQPFDEGAFLKQVDECFSKYGRVFIVTNEMLSNTDGDVVGEAVQSGPRDGLGRVLYSLSTGTGNYLANLIWTRLKLQARCLRPGNLGRAMSFCQSDPDRSLALAVGREAVKVLLAGDRCRHMIAINEHLQLSAQSLNLAAGEKPLPGYFLHTDVPFQVSDTFKQFAAPLAGEISPLFNARNLKA